MSIKILATGDLHIGLRVSGVPGIADEISTKDAWKKIVSWSINNKIDAIALTGDIIDRNNRYYEAKGPLETGFKELGLNNIQVFMVAGNHDFDVLPQIARPGAFPNVHLLGRNGTWEVVEFNGIQLAGWSFPSEHFYDDPVKKFDQNLLKSNMPTIGLLHGDVYERSSRYAPLSIDSLKNMKLHTWILGHIHKSEEWHGIPYACYTGSPLALAPNETGIHGPLLFEISNGKINPPERVLYSATRFETIDVDITGTTTEEDFRTCLFDRIGKKNNELEKELLEIEYMAYRVNFKGNHNNPDGLYSWSKCFDDYDTKFYETKIRISGIEMNIGPAANLEELANDSTPVGLLAKTIIAMENNETPGHLRKMLDDWKIHFSKINNWDTYDAVRRPKINDEELEKEGRRYILKESRRLIGEMLHQISKK